ncbi:hypothetical protein [Yoonia sp.]|uniref:hypothetical protein n=1 Tax=Yoonia sp. TaxID=2212373 RepID=UPI003F6CD0D5
MRPDQGLNGHNDDSATPPPFSVEETYWGYIVRPERQPSLGIVLAQALSFLAGAGLLTASIGTVVFASAVFTGDVGPMRIGAAVLFGSVAIYLLWFASRGTQPELQVDTSVGEIREVIQNRVGWPTTVGCYGFDAIGGVFMDKHPTDDSAMLILRYRDTAQTLCVAEGAGGQLVPLRDRLGQDLMIEPKTGRANAA